MRAPPGIPITFYNSKDTFGELSTFYRSDIEYEGVIYPSAEHLYQALRFIYPGAPDVNQKAVESIRISRSPNNARLLAEWIVEPSSELFFDWRKNLLKKARKFRNLGVVQNPEFNSESVLRTVLSLKFNQDTFSRELLMSTGDNDIIYQSGDNNNLLGRLLVEIRSL